MEKNYICRLCELTLRTDSVNYAALKNNDVLCTPLFLYIFIINFVWNPFVEKKWEDIDADDDLESNKKLSYFTNYENGVKVVTKYSENLKKQTVKVRYSHFYNAFNMYAYIFLCSPCLQSIYSLSTYLFPPPP